MMDMSLAVKQNICPQTDMDPGTGLNPDRLAERGNEPETDSDSGPGETGIVFDIKEFAVYDGPGIRTTVFLKGCPLRCQWCHNPEGLAPEPEIMVSTAACTHCGACLRVCPSPERCRACGACIPVCRGGYRRMAGTGYTAEALARRLAKDRDVYAATGGGITFSGGEPFLQWPFVTQVMDRLEGIHLAMETSGFTSDVRFREAMDRCSLMLMDWKVSGPDLHRHFTGVDQAPIRRHLEMLTVGKTPFILRMPIIPGVNDDPEHFETAAALVKGAEALVRIEVLPYQRAAGAKYSMVGRTYEPEFYEEAVPRFYPEVFEREHLPYRIMKGF